MKSKNGISAKCGGSRRGCCIIVPVAHRDGERDVLVLYQLPTRGPSSWAVVSIPNPTTPGELGEAPR